MYVLTRSAVIYCSHVKYKVLLSSILSPPKGCPNDAGARLPKISMPEQASIWNYMMYDDIRGPPAISYNGIFYLRRPKLPGWAKVAELVKLDGYYWARYSRIRNMHKTSEIFYVFMIQRPCRTNALVCVIFMYGFTLSCNGYTPLSEQMLTFY